MLSPLALGLDLKTQMSSSNSDAIIQHEAMTQSILSLSDLQTQTLKSSGLLAQDSKLLRLAELTTSSMRLNDPNDPMISNEPEGSYLYKISRSPGDNELAFTGQKLDPVTKTYTKRSKPNHPGRQVGTTTVVISSLNWLEALRGPGIFCHGRQTLDIVQSGALTGPRQFIPYTITDEH